MRLFVATDLPPSVISSVRNLQTELRTADDSVRWVRKESLHLTLKFLGELPESRMEDIGSALGAVRMTPFEVELSGTGFFPNDRAARVFWAGVHSPGLASLRELVDERMRAVGFAPERRKFRPHVTLARNSGRQPIDREFVEKTRPFRALAFGRFETDRFSLYESRLETGGAVYTRRREYMLGVNGTSGSPES